MNEVLEQEAQRKEVKTNIINAWSALVNDPNNHPDSKQHAYYIVLRSIVAKVRPSNVETMERLKAAFGPVTNKTELENGRRRYDTLYWTLTDLQYGARPLDVSEDLHTEAKETVKELAYMARQLYYGQ